MSMLKAAIISALNEYTNGSENQPTLEAIIEKHVAPLFAAAKTEADNLRFQLADMTNAHAEAVTQANHLRCDLVDVLNGGDRTVPLVGGGPLPAETVAKIRAALEEAYADAVFACDASIIRNQEKRHSERADRARAALALLPDPGGSTTLPVESGREVMPSEREDAATLAKQCHGCERTLGWLKLQADLFEARCPICKKLHLRGAGAEKP